MNKLNNESGRSMVEMLGVLAIIGVLSVTGIYGYKQAMNKMKANEALNFASMVYAQAAVANAGTCQATTNSFGMTAPASIGGSAVSVHVTCSTSESGKDTVTIVGLSDDLKAIVNNVTSDAFTITAS